jgi:hypothetical protein
MLSKITVELSAVEQSLTQAGIESVVPTEGIGLRASKNAVNGKGLQWRHQ